MKIKVNEIYTDFELEPNYDHRIIKDYASLFNKIEKLVSIYPNDQKLGEKIRNFVNKHNNGRN